MARQDVVRALVDRGQLDALRDELIAEVGVAPEQFGVSDVSPGRYRDAQPDIELRELVRAGRARLVVGVVGGAALGALIALAVPALRDLLPFSALLLALGGAWATGAVVAGRAVQRHRDEGARPEKIHEVDDEQARHLAILVIRDVHDHVEVMDRLHDRGFTILDPEHPRVGHRETGARPADGDDETAGPPAG